MKQVSNLLIQSVILIALIGLYLDGEPAAKASLTVSKPKTDLHSLIHQAVKDSLTPAISPNLVLAVIKQESSFRVQAVNESSKNPHYHSYGLMQISRAKAIDYGYSIEELFDPENNIYLGVKILRDCLNRELLLDKALACYNGGEGWRNNPTRKANALRYARQVLARL